MVSHMEVKPKKITNKDKKWINDYLKEHFGPDAVFDYNERSVKLYDNDILIKPEFLHLLSKFKVIVIPSLF
jgi:hypothetical protein